jgi:hypothetical protein
VEAGGSQSEKCQDKKTMTVDTYIQVRIRNLEMHTVSHDLSRAVKHLPFLPSHVMSGVFLHFV